MPQASDPSTTDNPGSAQLSYAGAYNPFRNNQALSSPQPSYSQYGGSGGAHSFDMSNMNANLPEARSMPTVDEFKTQYKVIPPKDQRHFYKPGRVRKYQYFSLSAKYAFAGVQNFYFPSEGAALGD
jgi:hypothetical protein